MEPQSYKIMKDEMKKRPAMAISKMYNSLSKDCEFYPEDNFYAHSVFGKTTSKDKSHFVIHPEWTSERVKQKKSYR